MFQKITNLQTQQDGNRNQSEKIPLQSLTGSYARSLWSLYCCSHLKTGNKHLNGYLIIFIGTIISSNLPAALPAKHLLVLMIAPLPVNVLLKWVEIQEGQNFTPRVVSPVRRDHLFFDWTCIPKVKG